MRAGTRAGAVGSGRARTHIVSKTSVACSAWATPGKRASARAPNGVVRPAVRASSRFTSGRSGRRRYRAASGSGWGARSRSSKRGLALSASDRSGWCRATRSSPSSTSARPGVRPSGSPRAMRLPVTTSKSSGRLAVRSAAKRRTRSWASGPSLRLALVQITRKRSGLPSSPRRAWSRRSSSPTSAPRAPRYMWASSTTSSRRFWGSECNHSRVCWKIGRSMGRISMYSSIE